MEFKAGGLLGETIEEFVLACATNYEEALQLLAAVKCDAVQDLCILCGETMKN